jgi:hypothetical protein
MRAAIVCLLALLAGCAPTTSVVMLDPARQYAPTTSVRIFLKPPAQPYVEIAKLESKGLPGEPETDVLEDARTRAQALGAHGIVVLETTSHYEPPVVFEDPWLPPYPWYYDRWYGYRYMFRAPLYPYPYYAPERALPGGQVYVVRSVAIRFEGEKEPANGR